MSNAGNPSRGAISTNTSGGPSFNLLNNPNVLSGVRTVSWTGNVTVPTLRLYLGHANNYGTRSYIRSVKITGSGVNPFVGSGFQQWCAEFDFLVSAGGWMGDEPSSGSWNSIHKVGFGWESGANPPFNDIETVAIRRNDLNNAVLRHVEFLVNNAGNPSRGAISTNSTGGPSFNLLNAPGIPTGIQPVTWWGDVNASTLRLYLGHSNNYGTRSYIQSVKLRGTGANPFVPTISLDNSTQAPDQDAYIYRAPIAGNDTYENLTVNNNTRPIVMDSYGIDPLTRHLWLHTNYGWVKATANDFAQNGTILRPVGCEWAQDDNYTGGDRIIIPPMSLGNFQLPLSEVLRIVSNGVADQSYTLPQIANVQWPEQDGVPVFSFFPISLEQLCSSTRAELHGLGYYIGSGDPYDNPESHPGVDFFAPVGSNVYSIADNGLVVGIGVEGFDTRSASRWGSASVDEGTGFSIIVRYGHLYVLYGHLLEVNEAVYVGKQVNAGDLLGSLGTFPGAEPHLHLEVRSYGASVTSGALVLDSQGDGNDYGILKLGPEQALNIYDCIQFFGENAQINQRDNTTDSPVVVNGPGADITDNDTVTFGTPTVTLDCSLSQPLTLTYRTNLGIVGEVLSLDGNTYRGFVLLEQSIIDPFDPADATAQP